MVLCSPLEQFENHLIFPIRIGFFELSLSSFSFSLLFCFFLFCMLTFIGGARLYLVPSPIQHILESLYLVVLSILKLQTGVAGFLYFPYVFSLFCFIFFSNFLGLIPYSFTPTAQLFVPFFLAFVSNVALLIIGFYRNGFSFIQLFVPSGISPALIPLIFTIELSTYLLRTFSLFLRLFANMIAGHTLLFICSMVLTIGVALASPVLFFVGYLLVIAVCLLELLIAFLQAYVFAVLFCVYLNDSLHPNH